MAERKINTQEKDSAGVPVYPSNSTVAKEAPTTSNATDERKKVEKIADGKVKKPSLWSKLKSNLFNNDDNIGDYLVFDVFIPAAKNVISDAITGAIQMLLYGDNRRPNGVNRDRGRSTYTSYGRYYDRDNRREREERRNPRQVNPRSVLDYDNVVVDTRREAELVLAQMDDQIAVYGMATQADFYDALGLDTEYTDNKVGWKDLRNAQIERRRDGYGFILPRPEYID